MRKPLFLVVLLAAGCGGNPSQDRHKSLVTAINEAVDILTTVNDKESADQARPKVMEVGERIRELYKQGRHAKDTARDLENMKYAKELAKEQAELEAARDRYGKEAARVSDVPGGVQLVRTMTGYIYPSSVR